MVTNTLSNDTIFIIVLPWMTEQQASKQVLSKILLYQVWAEAMNVGQKALCVCYLS